MELARAHPGKLWATVGCHPTRCGEFEEEGPEQYLASLLDLVKNNRDLVVAIGEFGLDYDRTKFCSAETQRKYFLRQLELSRDTGLPAFLHCRAAGADLVSILSEHRDTLPGGGVVHSFDGTAEERDEILGLGLHIGINGCSLKTEENLAVMAGIPVSRLMIETDCPWCEVRASHAGHKLISSKFPQVRLARRSLPLELSMTISSGRQWIRRSGGRGPW